MGASGSMVANRDRNIEMNIADEAKSGTSRINHHGTQSTGAIFSSLKPRQRHLDGTVHQSVSLKSSGSFDPSSASVVVPSEAIDRVRKEYETLKCTKEQEIQALQKKEQKLETENNRLRAELQALNKQCQKLRLERDSAVESSQETTERAIALEQDREKIQRQFKIFRETKESEIQALLQAKRQLESKLHTIEAHGVATMDDHNYNSSSLHNTSMTSDILVPGKTWWAPAPEGDTNSLIGCNITQSNYAASVHDMNEMSHDQPNLPGFPQKDAWMTSSNMASLDPLSNNLPISYATHSYGHYMLKCYISATPDQVEVVKNLISHPSIQKLSCRCLKEGYNLSLVQ
uniref:Uncharacterized protein n=1 Tax=Ciona savignyi TaxID=51511 RepID=H2YTG3_CIOSA